MTEVFIPTFELVLYERDRLGQLRNRKRSYTAHNGSQLAGCHDKHRRSFPLPRRKKPTPR